MKDDCVFIKYTMGMNWCRLATVEMYCKPKICPVYRIWKLLEGSTGIYLGKDMTGI